LLADGSYKRIEREEGTESFSAHTYFMNNASLSGRGKSLEKNEPPTVDLPFART